MQSERILAPLRAFATIVSTLTAAFLAAIIFTHLAHSEPRPDSPPVRVNAPGAFSTDARPDCGAYCPAPERPEDGA
jgi:hypothetical protein